jgi:hypothetical protein
VVTASTTSGSGAEKKVMLEGASLGMVGERRRATCAKGRKTPRPVRLSNLERAHAAQCTIEGRKARLGQTRTSAPKEYQNFRTCRQCESLPHVLRLICVSRMSTISSSLHIPELEFSASAPTSIVQSHCSTLQDHHSFKSQRSSRI